MCVTYGAESSSIANTLKLAQTTPQRFVSVQNICGAILTFLAFDPFGRYDRNAFSGSTRLWRSARSRCRSPARKNATRPISTPNQDHLSTSDGR